MVGIWRPRDHRVGKPLRKRALVSVSRPGGLRSRRAQVSSLRFFIQYQTQKLRGRTDVPLARRPVGSDATTNARVRSSRASHRRQAIPDRLPFCCQSAVSPFRPNIHLFAGFAFFAVQKNSMGHRICVYLRNLRAVLSGMAAQSFTRSFSWVVSLGVLVVLLVRRADLGPSV